MHKLIYISGRVFNGRVMSFRGELSVINDCKMMLGDPTVRYKPYVRNTKNVCPFTLFNVVIKSIAIQSPRCFSVESNKKGKCNFI